MAEQKKMTPEEVEAKKVFDKQVADQKDLTTSIDSNKAPADPNQEPLGGASKEPQVAKTAAAQEGANRLIEGARSNLFGDTTSARGAETVRDTPNVEGLHGRDGGFRGSPEGGGPNNPAPNVDGTDGQVAR